MSKRLEDRRHVGIELDPECGENALEVGGVGVEPVAARPVPLAFVMGELVINRRQRPNSYFAEPKYSTRSHSAVQSDLEVADLRNGIAFGLVLGEGASGRPLGSLEHERHEFVRQLHESPNGHASGSIVSGCRPVSTRNRCQNAAIPIGSNWPSEVRGSIGSNLPPGIVADPTALDRELVSGMARSLPPSAPTSLAGRNFLSGSASTSCRIRSG